MDRFQRTRLLYGEKAMDLIHNATVAVFGIGGVGGHCAESLARCGVKRLILADRDAVDITNINRQAVANIKTVGMPKVDVMAERIKDINPDTEVICFRHSFSDDYGIVFDCYDVNAVADCIDDVKAKVNLISLCCERNIDIVSSMGTAMRRHPEMLVVTDVFKTTNDPLARVMRHELKKLGIGKLTVVTSTETPGERVDGIMPSSPFVPAAAGLTVASAIAEKIIAKNV